MKKIFLAFLASLAIISCQKEKTEEVKTENTELAMADYELFGSEITPEGAISPEEMLKMYESMATGDSIEVTLKSSVTSVCQKKGCWMKLDLGQPEKEAIINFKDYKFFVPMDAEGSDAIVHGMAFKREISVAELKHRAEDGGKSEEEIAAITEPELKYDFVADGVLLKKKG
ncbi:MAG: DUF4920 domain-containing protein [Weeksellaceae bacterium]